MKQTNRHYWKEVSKGISQTLSSCRSTLAGFQISEVLQHEGLSICGSVCLSVFMKKVSWLFLRYFTWIVVLFFLHSELIEVGKDRIPHPLAEFTNSSKFRLIKNFWQCLTFKNKKNHFYACKLLSPTDKKNKKWNWTGYFAKYFKIFCLYCFEFWFLLDWCHMQRPFTISSVLIEIIICQNVLGRVKIWMRNLLTRAKFTWLIQA